MLFTATTDARDSLAPSALEGSPLGLTLLSCPAGEQTLEARIETILSGAGHQPAFEAVRLIFNNLVRLLECLYLMEANLHQIKETLALLELIRLETLALLEFPVTEALQVEGISENLYEVLDGMSFALKHEVRRVFEENLVEPPAPEPLEITQAKYGDAHRMLTNCFQQSVITLAQVFDPRLDGRQLFDNSKARLKQSLVLCKDLWTMINLSKRVERNWDEVDLTVLMDRVNVFRKCSMQYLMYRDWGEFDRLARQLDDSACNQLECEPLLHRFLCYLETLLAQVKLRGVLADLMPGVFSNDIESEEAEPDWTAEEVHLAFELYMAG